MAAIGLQLGPAPAGRKLGNCGCVVSASAAEGSAEQAERLKAMPGLLALTNDEEGALDTASTPAFRQPCLQRCRKQHHLCSGS